MDRDMRIDVICIWIMLVGMIIVGAVAIGNAQSHGTASEEVPRGATDGVNGTFTLNFQPLPFASLHVYRNGLRLHRGVDYTLGGQYYLQLIFSPACCIPQPGDVLLADYTY
jgi:hypothetical protein